MNYLSQFEFEAASIRWTRASVFRVCWGLLVDIHLRARAFFCSWIRGGSEVAWWRNLDKKNKWAHATTVLGWCSPCLSWCPTCHLKKRLSWTSWIHRDQLHKELKRFFLTPEWWWWKDKNWMSEQTQKLYFILWYLNAEKNCSFIIQCLNNKSNGMH